MKIGSEWDGWTIEKYLGEGSFAKVYKVVKEEFGNTYESALKVIRIPQNAGQISALRNEGMSDEGIKSYFYSVVESITTEFAILSQLSGNSNIISYEDHTVKSIDDGFGWDIFLRMELAEPLFEHIHGNVLTAGDVIKIGIDICKALEACHSSKIIHRDIKPDNIFYSRQGTYKLGDFGIARRLEEMNSGMTKVGTFSYMAPEVYIGKTYDETVDVYSLGIILYQFLNNNRRPFLPDYPEVISVADNEKANLRRMKGDRMPYPVSADGRLAEAVCKACAFDPDDRFSSAREMREELESILMECETGTVVYPFMGADENRISLTEDSDPFIDETVTMFTSDAFLERPSQISLLRMSKENQDSAAENGADEDKEAAAPASDKRVMKRIFTVLLVAAVAILGAYTAFVRTVPDITGLPVTRAEERLRKAGLKYKEADTEFSDSVERGSVISQSIKAGEKVRTGTDLSFVVSRGRAIDMPDLTGMKYDKAEKLAEDLGLRIEPDEETPSMYSDNIPKGCILNQDITEGTVCEEGAVIHVITSRGVEKVKVPDVSGKSRDEAVSILKNAKLAPEVVTQYSAAARGFVSSQSVSAGTKVDKGTKITVYVSAGRAPQVNVKVKSKKKKTSQKQHALGKKL